MLDDSIAVSGIGKLQVEELSIFFGLLESVPRVLVGCLCLDDRHHYIGSIAKQIIGTLLRLAPHLRPRDHDSAIGERTLLVYLVVIPTRGVKLGENVLSTSIGFCSHNLIQLYRT